MGYGTGATDSIFANSCMKFDDIQHPVLSHLYIPMNFYSTQAVTSDEEGNLQFYTNGIYVAGADHEQMQNGYGLNPGPDFGFFSDTGYRLDQGVISLPAPGQPDKYYIVHAEFERQGEPVFYSPNLRYTVVDMNLLNGAGAVTEKNVLLNEGYFDSGQLTAVKHANGSDWWVVQPDLETNEYYVYLLDQTGISLHDVQTIDSDFPDGLGQSVFTPDGTKYVRFQTNLVAGPLYFLVADFNRCTGVFSNYQSDNFFENSIGTLGTGGAVSSNSRYFYATTSYFLYKYDLWAEDIPGSRITILENDLIPAPVSTAPFYLCQLAPDGKIYIATHNGNNVYHVIHRPNRAGLACQAEQRGLNLPSMNLATIPNNPNYRLGPIDGSPCDTLSIDNLPLCDFRYDPDTLDDKTIEFTEVTHYEPTDWYWTFGDGNTSTELNPVHEYESSGTYEVCLTVSNEYGSDSKCRTLQIISTATAEVYRQEEITSLPNPARDFVYLQMQRGLPSGSVWQLHDAGGRLVSSQPLGAGRRQRIDLADNLASGLYFQSISHGGRVLWRERVTVLP